jgi:hypothetical protein
MGRKRGKRRVSQAVRDGLAAERILTLVVVVDGNEQAGLALLDRGGDL